MVDVRNHGDSPHLPTMSYELMSDDLVRLFQSQNIKSSIVIGIITYIDADIYYNLVSVFIKS